MQAWLNIFFPPMRIAYGACGTITRRGIRMNRNDAPVQSNPSAEHAHDGHKAAWQAPQLVRMGHLKEFVQAAGKGGSQFDMDPQGSGKSGLG